MTRKKKTFNDVYAHYLVIPALVIFFVFFLLPVIVSFPFSFTVWTLTEWRFTGLDNYFMFFREHSLRIGIQNTLVFAVVTCVLKVIFGLGLAVLLTSNIRIKSVMRSIVFFPWILSTVAVGLAFQSFMHPSRGIINSALAVFNITGPVWLGDPSIALLSVALVDVWRGAGMAAMIYIAGIMSIPDEYGEALSVDGGNAWDKFRHITLPLVRPAMNTVIILSFIGGLRSFDLIWAMTQGGPGFSTDVMASVIYKLYINGFYGLSTAGNIILFIIIAILAFPLYHFLTKKEVAL